jgi:hypothetical protein
MAMSSVLHDALIVPGFVQFLFPKFLSLNVPSAEAKKAA